MILRARTIATLALLLCATSFASAPVCRSVDLQRDFAPFAFGGDGAIRATPHELTLEPGAPLTGGTFSTTLPDSDYELSFSAARVSGLDFFCGMTFPTKRGCLTLVLGGWAGAVCGLSSLDGLDASSNATRTLRSFPNGRDVDVRIEVRGERVRVSIDGAEFLDCDTTGKSVEVRQEMEPLKLFGFCCYLTTARLSRLRWRPL